MKLDPGETIRVEWLKLVHAYTIPAMNDLAAPFEVELFVGPLDDPAVGGSDEVVLFVEQDWLDAASTGDREYARHYVDGVVVDRTDPASHPRIESLEAQS